MSKEILAPIFDEYIKYRVVPESVIKEELQRILDHAYLWSLVCFGIGAEEGAGNITSDTALGYLLKVNHAYGTHLVYYLGKLIETSVITMKQAEAESVKILQGVLRWSNKIEDFGKQVHTSVEWQSTEFLDALGKLSL